MCKIFGSFLRIFLNISGNTLKLLFWTFSTQLFQVVLKITTIDFWKTEKGHELGQFYSVPKLRI